VIVGVLVMIAGAAVVEPVLIVVGAIIIAGGFLTQRMNRTETRLRDEFRDKGES
jgi:protein-S-isoprenylcysteine O-methyltransferase Ste14